ncbi:hypothetical protein AA309_17300 [Microvirga vignae]|uniref:Uncharacterized protein n=1 Tax=Microvirga vignae TaxID=1225564 RepID=A0A0H1R9M4_9HYPH|nr:hypothetical protein [Microvirga vignae]KLK91868.1 hypothetical protein AA309_17300 [Microvirga vignae]
MPGIARQFEPQITRSGGAPSKFRFTIRCSECVSTDSYEASRPTSDDAVKAYFSDRGWLLGRAPSFDICPACLAHPRHGQEMKSSNMPRRETGASNKRRRDTAEILARHLGKPEALAAEVFRPNAAPPSQPSALPAPQQRAPSPALSPEVEHALTGMAADLKGLRSTMELMAEQVSKLVALGGQQIEAIARLAPLVVQSAEGISGGLREVAGAVRSIPSPPFPTGEATKPATEDMKVEEQPALELNLIQEVDRPIGSEPGPAPTTTETRKPSKQRRLPKGNEALAPKAGSAPVVVKSIPDAKRPDRYYTSIRLPRALWDSAGFGSEDRLLLDWSGKALTIERATEGGVKPKSIGDASVVLQSWKLGNLNFDQPKVTGAKASLRLAAGRTHREV